MIRLHNEHSRGVQVGRWRNVIEHCHAGVERIGGEDTPSKKGWECLLLSADAF